jgi:predicted nuclease of predicted toxin-antitoxin system
LKFIVDAQLPKSLSDFLNQKGFDSIHTLDLPERNNSKDAQIARLANEQDRIVISKDAVFLESYLIKSGPKKLIIIKIGNISNKQLIQLIENNLEILITMISRSNLIEVSNTDIAEHE